MSSTFRVPKTIRAHRVDEASAVVASTAGTPETVFSEIADLVRQLIDIGKVSDPNQIAFLFPSFWFNGEVNKNVLRARDALQAVGLKVYAPRAGRFLELEEAADLFGVFVQVFGRPERGAFPGRDYAQFHDWIDAIDARGRDLLAEDPNMAQFVEAQRAQLARCAKDYNILLSIVERNRWTIETPYDIDSMKRVLHAASGLSDQAKRALISQSFENVVKARLKNGQKPFTLDYVLKRATAINWSVLDLFYRLSGFGHFKAMFDLAERGEDEGPICNLGLITQYLARFMDEYVPIIPSSRIADGSFVRLLFGSYLYALFRRGEAEFEDADDPFPKGRIPFLTIHQSKGLEFPVVVLGTLRKGQKKTGNAAPFMERFTRPLLTRTGEPLDRVAEFDMMRMFYVALSRAKNLLILPHFKGTGQWINIPFETLLNDKSIPRIPKFDIASVPVAQDDETTNPRNYSFTSDYLLYEKCARQYMIFRKYGFVAAQSQTMFFGSVVHRTLEDLHQRLIAERNKS